MAAIGVLTMELRIEHARSLKDKRQVLQSAVSRLKNMGFSVSQLDYDDIPKQASVGFAYVSSSAEAVQQKMRERAVA